MPCTPHRQSNVSSFPNLCGVLFKMTDEVVESETYGALPLSYGATLIGIAPAGFEPATPGFEGMYSNPAVGHASAIRRKTSVCVGDEVCDSETLPYGNRTREPRCGPQTHWTSRMDSKPAVAAVFNVQRSIAESSFRFRPSVPATKLLVVDRRLRLRETPVPFTSRSPGIATLGPSWTPDRQLDSWRDHPTKEWFGRGTFSDVVRTGSQAVRDAGGSRTHLKLLCRQPPGRLAPAS